MGKLPPSPEEVEIERLTIEIERIQRHLAHQKSALEQLRRDLADFEYTFSLSITPLQRQLEQLSHSSNNKSPSHEIPKATSKASPQASAMYRTLVKKIHPDLARDDSQRDLFEALMIRANEAYAQSDEPTLSKLLLEAGSALTSTHTLDTIHQWVQLINTYAAHRWQLASVNQQYDGLISSEAHKLYMTFQPDVASAIELFKRELQLQIQLHQVNRDE